MNYVKKMCILRQVKQGFSGDGKPLSGLIKIEQYGKNLAVEISVINFAPLSSGEYYCLLSDGKGKTEMLSLRGKSLFNLLSDLDISAGFCAVICYVKAEIVPIAYGINGNGSYDWRSILNATLPPVFPSANRENAFADVLQNAEFFPTNQKNAAPVASTAQKNFSNDANNTFETQYTPPVYEFNEKITQDQTQKKEPPYDDESVATDNYFDDEEEDEYESNEFSQTRQNAHVEGATEKSREKTGSNAAKNGNADCVLHSFKTDSDGYYASVKAEIDELFRNYPKDKTLNGAFSCSEWIRLKGSHKAPEYLIGVIYDDGKAKYICYALSAENKDDPPAEIKNVCSFVPCSLLREKEGFFVIFQSAATGECIKPTRA